MALPMDIVKAMPAVERQTGLSLVEVAGKESLAILNRNAAAAVDSVFESASRHLQRFGVQLQSVDAATGAVELATPATVKTRVLGNNRFAIEPASSEHSLIFSAGGLGRGQATRINAYENMVDLIHPGGVMTKGAFPVAPETARHIHLENYKGFHSLTSYDKFRPKSDQIFRGIYGKSDHATGAWVTYPNSFSSRPDQFGTSYQWRRPGIFGSAENPISKDVHTMVRHSNGETDIWLVSNLKKKVSPGPLRYDAMNRLKV